MSSRMASSPALDPVDRRILVQLATAGELSTTELAKALAEKRDRIYRHCCHMQSAGRVQSKLVDGPILRFCMKERKIVVGKAYLRCVRLHHSFRVIKVERRLWAAKQRRRRRAGGETTREH